jgi:hypothetical protein
VSFGLVNALMLAGLAGLAIPPILHRLRRRPGEVVDWAAMQFLDEEPAARRRPRLDDLPLMLVRMAVLGLIAVSLARPYVGSGTTGTRAGTGGPRLVVLVLDGSASMGRRGADGTPREAAVSWALALLKTLEPGDRVALLLARDRVARVVDPPTADLARVARALDALPPPRGSSDLPSAVGEAFRILEGVGQVAADIILLSDHRRLAYRTDEPARWQLLRDLRARLPGSPRLWALDFDRAQTPAAGSPADGSVGPVSVSRDPIAPGTIASVSADVANAGPGPLARLAELLIDSQATSIAAQPVGPIPPGARATVRFRASIADAGAHLVGIRLRPADDPNPVDDTSERPVTVRDSLAALLVDGEPGTSAGAIGFLRAALAPAEDEAPLVRARVSAAGSLTPTSLEGQALVILAGVDRLPPEFVGPLARFVGQGGGLLVIPGNRAETPGWVDQLGPRGVDLLPALPGVLKGDAGRREAVGHPTPASFDGPVMAPLAAGDAPALGLADLFSYRVLRPLPGSTTAARLDTGDPWIVERPRGRGRVALLAGPLDANSGTLPISPDFVPLIHEWAARLGGPGVMHRSVQPGEPLAFDLDPPPPADLATLTVTDPDGIRHPATIERSAGRAVARLRVADVPGIYRLEAAGPRGRVAYAMVAADPREADPARLTPADAALLARGWPLTLNGSPDRLKGLLIAPRGSGRHEAWRPLLLLALGGLALEALMTRLRAR